MNVSRMALWLATALIVLGTSASIRAFEPEYVIVASFWDYPESVILDMDSDANVFYRESLQTASGINRSDVSPDGRLVMLGLTSSIYTPVRCFAFFLDAEGNVDETVDLIPFPHINGGAPTSITFSSDNHLFFAGTNPFTFCGQYESDPTTIAIKEDTAALCKGSGSLNYSILSRTLIYQDYSSLHDERNDNSSGLDLMRSVQVKYDGSFGPITSSLQLPFRAIRSMDTSIDGRWVATTSMAETTILLANNDADGTLLISGELAISKLDFAYASSIKFSPCYPFLYVLGSGSKALLSIYFGEDGHMYEVTLVQDKVELDR